MQGTEALMGVPEFLSTLLTAVAGTICGIVAARRMLPLVQLGISLLSALFLVSCSRPVPPAANATEAFLDSGGVRIHYTVQGEGSPVLLLHGYMGSAASSFDTPGIIEALARNFEVIAMDMRGHGQSDKPHDPEAYGTVLLQDIIRLVDYLQIGCAGGACHRRPRRLDPAKVR